VGTVWGGLGEDEGWEDVVGDARFCHFPIEHRFVFDVISFFIPVLSPKAGELLRQTFLIEAESKRSSHHVGRQCCRAACSKCLNGTGEYSFPATVEPLSPLSRILHPPLSHASAYSGITIS